MAAEFATLRQLVGTSRPDTGLFAFLLTLIGFRCFTEVPWAVSLITASVFALVTASIMSYNDLIDREVDQKKGKNFASSHSLALWQYLWGLSCLTVLLLVVLVLMSSILLALFCLSIWVLGLYYSHIHRRWYGWNNLIVALCSGAPVLCAVVHHREWEVHSLLLFGIFVSLILLREVYKDIEDMEVDRGYKRTLPLEAGLGNTMLYLLTLNHVPVLLLTVYPGWVLKIVLPFCVLMQPYHMLMLLRTERILRAKWLMDWLIRSILLLVLLTQ